MANVNRVDGFGPVKYNNGAPWNGACHLYSVAAADTTALFIGDLVKLDGTADANGVRGVTQAAASNAVIGAVVGFLVDYTNINAAPYRLASTARYALVVDDPNVLFEAQEDGDTDPLEMVDAGLIVKLVVGAGNTTRGVSVMKIDSNTEATGATLPLKLIQPVKRSGNELVAAGQAYTRWLVKINNHQLAAHTGTAGV
jgi:hypothetical protein